MADETELMKTYKEQAKRWREEAHEHACDADYWRAETLERIVKEQRTTLEQMHEKLTSLCYIAPEDVNGREAALADMFQTLGRARGALDRDFAPIVPEPADEPKPHTLIVSPQEKKDLARERRAMSDLKERLRNELNTLVYTAPEDGDGRAASINRLFRIVQNETEPGATDAPVPEPADDPQDEERPQDLAERRRIVPEVAGPPSKIAHLPERLGRPNEVQVGYDGAWDDDDLLG